MNKNINIDAQAEDGRLHGSQIRAARALLQLTIADVSALTGLAINTIRRAEASDTGLAIHPNNARVLLNALQAKGVVFIDGDGLGPGVRLLRPAS